MNAVWRQFRSLKHRRNGYAWPHAGFSLLELLLVIAVLALSSALVLPHVALITSGDRLERLHHQIGRLCQETFFRAVFSGQPHRVNQTADHYLEVQDQTGQRIASAGPFLRPLPLPTWCEPEWPPTGWRAEPEGWCDAGPITLLDKDSGNRVLLRFGVHDAQPLPIDTSRP